MRHPMRGYSLVELLASMSIIMTLSAVSFPTVNTSVETNRLNADARRLRAQCQNARFLAISKNVSHRVHLNGAAVEIQRRNGTEYTTIDSFQLSQGNRIQAVWANDPVFSPRGTVSPGGSVTLESPRGMRRTISISVLGRVTEQ